MDAATKQSFIRRKALENANDLEGSHIRWSRHGISEAVNDGLNRRDIEKALATCELIEDYPGQHRPLPDCLVMSFSVDERPLHAVVAIDEVNDRIFIVTVYVPDLGRWNNDWRTRR